MLILDDLFGQCKAQPGAFIAAGNAGIELLEFREEARKVVRMNTDPCINDADPDLPMGVWFRNDLYQSIGIGELYGVGDKIVENLLELLRIEHDDVGFRGESGIYGNALLFRQRPNHGADFLRNLPYRKCLRE